MDDGDNRRFRKVFLFPIKRRRKSGRPRGRFVRIAHSRADPADKFLALGPWNMVGGDLRLIIAGAGRVDEERGGADAIRLLGALK
jgi:hypothetical protein